MFNDKSIIEYFLLKLKEVIREVLIEILSEHFKKDRYNSPSYNPNELLTLEEAAKRCGVCTRTLISKVTQGKLINGGSGRKYRFRVGDIDDFLFNESKGKK